MAEGAGVVDRLLLDVTSRVSSGARALPNWLAKIGAVAATATAALAGVTLASAAYADNAAKTSDQIGVQVEDFAALSVAAELSNTSIMGLVSASNAYARNAEAAADGSKRQAAAFKRAGLDARELLNSNRAFADVLPEILDGLQRIEQPTLRQATAQQILGRGAKEMASLIRGGSAALTDARKVVDAWGLSVTRAQTDGAERLNDSIALLRARVRGLGIAFGLRLVPMANRVVDVLGRLADRARPTLFAGLEAGANALERSFDALTTPLGRVVSGLVAIGVALQGIKSAGGLLQLASRVPVIGPALASMATGAKAAAVAVGPLALVVGALVFGLDDMFAFLRGGDSIIGAWARSMGVESEAYTALQSMVDLLGAFWDLGSAIVTQLPSEIAKLGPVAERAFGRIGVSIQPVFDMLSWIYDRLPSLSGLLTDFSRGAQFIAGAAAGQAAAIRQGGPGPTSSDAVQRAVGRLRAIDAQRQAVGVGTTNNAVTINVNGANDPAAVGREVDRRLQQHIGAAAGQAR